MKEQDQIPPGALSLPLPYAWPRAECMDSAVTVFPLSALKADPEGSKTLTQSNSIRLDEILDSHSRASCVSHRQSKKTDPLSIQVTAASDVNQINVCGPGPHTLI